MMAVMIQLLLIIIIPFFISVSMLLFKLTNIYKCKSSPNLPPGPPKLPLIGNLHNLLAATLPHRALHRLSLKHGPFMHLRLGQLSTVVVSSPDAARQVMKTHDLKFASRPATLAAEILLYNSTGITFSPPADYWRQLRKICTSELLSTKRVQSFRPLRERVFCDLASWIASNDGSPVNLSEKIRSSTYDFTTRAAFGEKSEKHLGRLLEIITEAFDLAAGFDIAELFPSIKLFHYFSRTRRRMTEMHLELDQILEEIVRDHKMDTSDKIHGEEDLVDVLLKYQDSGLEHPLTTDNIKAVTVDVIGAGSETSATTLDWAMAELLKNPRVLEKAQDEVRQVFDKMGMVDESHVPELKYLKLVIKETLRLHTPVPLLLPRKCDEACEINGYTIPVDTKIIVNAWAINRDPQYWQNPESFEPERFLDSWVDYKGSHFEYIPFGSGRRICPGITYGLANVEFPLAVLLFHFDWKLGEGVECEELDMKEAFGLTARREKELFVVPHVVKRLLPVK